MVFGNSNNDIYKSGFAQEARMFLEDFFFRLLRNGLFGNKIKTDDLSSEIDWEALLALAKRQTLTGVIGNAAFNLPPEMLPADVADWLKHFIKKNLNAHMLVNQTLYKTVRILNDEGVRCVLLKGQGVARCYPTPEIRQCGDIDLYICNGRYKDACAIVARCLHNAPEEPEIRERHTHLKHGSVEIELHSKAARMSLSWQDKRFQRWISSYLETEDGTRWEDFNGMRVNLPPVDFDVLFLFYHTWRHYLHEGIGLRQLCDWALFLHKYKDEIDCGELRLRLNEFGLMKAWQLIGFIVVDKLGLPEHEMPFFNPAMRKQSEKLLKRIMENGNFGINSQMSHWRWSEMPYFRRKLMTLYYYTKDYLFLVRYAPLQLTADYLDTLSNTGKRVFLHCIGKS